MGTHQAGGCLLSTFKLLIAVLGSEATYRSNKNRASAASVGNPSSSFSWRQRVKAVPSSILVRALCRFASFLLFVASSDKTFCLFRGWAADAMATATERELSPFAPLLCGRALMTYTTSESVLCWQAAKRWPRAPRKLLSPSEINADLLRPWHRLHSSSCKLL